MGSYRLFITLAISMMASTALALEAHEWGTFTSLVGSNGITQHGMYHEDEALPDFVHGFGAVAKPESDPLPLPRATPRPFPCNSKACLEDSFFMNNIVTQKMETPVIYFYSDSRQPLDLEVNVKFPNGIVTETFPAPIKTFPPYSAHPPLKGGDTTFKVKVMPSTVDKLPGSGVDNIYYHARNVASNVVKSNREREKFIFYRGLGTFQPKLTIRSEGEALYVRAQPNHVPQASFLVHVDENGHGQMMEIYFTGLFQRPIYASEIRRLKEHSLPASGQIMSGEATRTRLISALTKAGLKADEATAMINTWEHGYLKVPGLRLLYILPRHEADELLPLTITPQPSRTERVFVARIEVLLEQEERQILDRVLSLGDQFQVTSLGRFAEPMLRRVREVYVNRPSPEIEKVQVLDRLIEKAAKSSSTGILQ